MPSKSKKLLDRVRETIRLKHYSRKTEKTYVCAVSALSRSVIIDQEYRDFLYAPHLSIPDGSKTSKEGGELVD